MLFNNLSQGKKNVFGIGDVMMAMNFFGNMNAKSNVKILPFLWIFANYLLWMVQIIVEVPFHIGPMTSSM